MGARFAQPAGGLGCGDHGLLARLEVFDFRQQLSRLIAFELGLRFFTDYLEGNVYFKVRRPEQNLARALVQFKLTESIESQETAIRNIIRGIR